MAGSGGCPSPKSTSSLVDELSALVHDHQVHSSKLDDNKGSPSRTDDITAATNKGDESGILELSRRLQEDNPTPPPKRTCVGDYGPGSERKAMPGTGNGGRNQSPLDGTRLIDLLDHSDFRSGAGSSELDPATWLLPCGSAFQCALRQGAHEDPPERLVESILEQPPQSRLQAHQVQADESQGHVRFAFEIPAGYRAVVIGCRNS
jgi:hypothetical protein